MPQQRVAYEFAQMCAKPGTSRHWEPLLCPVKDRRWYFGTNSLSQDPFSEVSTDLCVVWQSGNVFDELMVQEWDAEFDGRGHRHLVRFQQKIFRQPDLRVHIKHAV